MSSALLKITGPSWLEEYIVRPIATGVLPTVPKHVKSTSIMVEYNMTVEQPSVMKPERVRVKYDGTTVHLTQEAIDQAFAAVDSSPSGPMWTYLTELNEVSTKSPTVIRCHQTRGLAEHTVQESAVRFVQFTVQFEAGSPSVSKILASVTECEDRVPIHLAFMYESKWDATAGHGLYHRHMPMLHA